MKKLKILAVFLIALCVCMSSCTKIWEDVWIERIPRPVVEIDTITIPPWDEADSINVKRKITSEYETNKENLRDNSVAGGDNAAGLSL